MSVAGKAFDFTLFRKIMGFASGRKSLLAGAALITLLSALLSPVRPYLVQYALDNFISNNDAEGLIRISIIIALVLLLETLTQYLAVLFSNLLALHVVHEIRIRLYKKLIHFKLSYFDKTPVGTLVTRCISDIQNISEIFSQGFLDIAGDLLKVIIIIIVMFYTNWKIAILSLCSLPLLIISTYIFKNAIRAAFNDVRTQVALLNAFVQEHINGMSVVQVFNRQHQEYNKFKTINNEHRNANNRSVWHYSVFFPVVDILSALSIGVLVWWGAKETLIGQLSVGTIVAFIMYINMLFRPIRQLADRFNTLQMGLICSERVIKVIETQEFNINEGSLKPKSLIGKIEFKNVWFAYQENNWVLKNVSFTINPGQKVAFVGATGSGKTTIASLLCRYYEIQKGEIYIDGINIMEYELNHLRTLIGSVMQDVFLFQGSIYDNIILGDYNHTEEEVIEAAKATGIISFIDKLPKGLNYQVMERGSLLSTGQRQLISFLRAYLYNPSIMILDEATSSIDSESEQLIQTATENLTRNRTSIIIAHRLSTIVNADKIIVLSNGELKESGTHDELLTLKGYYYQLFTAQNKSKVKQFQN
ncbi:MAG: ABC transporter ATP-binding protein [Bacteroidia bacterium]|nr:ABC transporter ATP-binding protein [Bacteroidia bacterium]MCZ2248190.1 ABC transporter ATP-binding protein/permease [Bacteroidia bacterium]